MMKKYKPTNAGIRGTVIVSYKKLLTTKKSVKSMTSGFRRAKGRNNTGRITSRFRGGGHKRKWREIDFLYNKLDIQGKIETVEYDPNRTAFISCVCYADGERRYVVTPNNVSQGDTIITSENAPIKTGNRTKLSNIPGGTPVYHVEIQKGGGAKIARGAGISAEILGHDGKYTQLKMPSSELKKVQSSGFASIGQISNDGHKLRNLGKAGRSRWLGRRPKVRGSAMNAVDHPFGGGEGKASRGRKRQVTKWGKPSGKGQKTRKPKKYSNKSLIRRRKVGKKK